jgi:hypothetical protein
MMQNTFSYNKPVEQAVGLKLGATPPRQVTGSIVLIVLNPSRSLRSAPVTP